MYKYTFPKWVTCKIGLVGRLWETAWGYVQSLCYGKHEWMHRGEIKHHKNFRGRVYGESTAFRNSDSSDPGTSTGVGTKPVTHAQLDF